ncbi:hypothetical protein SXCC_01527 [Gluconacetobacter sp. SXCC-1]|nr:hypothetical protein SXCC_01527 [Gluconacetobacter sp. SXCC-1]
MARQAITSPDGRRAREPDRRDEKATHAASLYRTVIHPAGCSGSVMPGAGQSTIHDSLMS